MTTNTSPGMAAILDAVRQFGRDTAAYARLGNIVARTQGDLIIFNYTARAMYAGTWNSVERVCRGLIVHMPTATIAARPFDKFFNLGEQPETAIEALPVGPVEVTEKVDGSLGVLYRAPDGHAVATRGSFTGPQAVWATEFLRANYRLEGLPDDLTLLFEIVYPENRDGLVIDYGDRHMLVLVGARRFGGYDCNYRELTELAGRHGFPLPKIWDVAGLGELAELAGTLTGIEGWVVRFANGLRVKVKTANYLRRFHAITHTTPEVVRDAITAGTFASLVADLPDDYVPPVRALAKVIELRANAHEAWLRARFAEIARLAADGRRAFAMAATAEHGVDAHCLFALLDGKPIRAIVLKSVDVSDLSLPWLTASG